jgi:nitrate reductase assembly molybdenum cofactor insertion protein NarJ
MRSPDELAEQAGDWSLMRLLLERPSDSWRQRLLTESKETVDPELTSAVQMAQAEGNDYLHEVLFGADGLLTSRESEYRFERDRGAVLADLEGMRERFGFSWDGSEPSDHILALVGLMAHIINLQANAVLDKRIGEALYLEGIAEWLRRGHLAWFTEQIAAALSGKPARRPSDSIRDRELIDS